jgi:prevent-host-death family protein
VKKSQDSVGVRKLRQNLSVYLSRVAAGEKLRVTEHGRTVAALVPFRDDDSAEERLGKQGRLIRAKGDLLELGPPQGRASTRISDALEKLRRERF